MVRCICGIKGQSWVRNVNKTYLDVDIAIVMDYVILAAAELGLGTCYIAAFNVDNAIKVLSLPPDVEPVLLTPLGNPYDFPKEKIRKILEN